MPVDEGPKGPNLSLKQRILAGAAFIAGGICIYYSKDPHRLFHDLTIAGQYLWMQAGLALAWWKSTEQPTHTLALVVFLCAANFGVSLRAFQRFRAQDGLDYMEGWALASSCYGPTHILGMFLTGKVTFSGAGLIACDVIYAAMSISLWWQLNAQRWINRKTTQALTGIAVVLSVLHCGTICVAPTNNQVQLVISGCHSLFGVVTVTLFAYAVRKQLKWFQLAIFLLYPTALLGRCPLITAQTSSTLWVGYELLMLSKGALSWLKAPTKPIDTDESFPSAGITEDQDQDSFRLIAD